MSPVDDSRDGVVSSREREGRAGTGAPQSRRSGQPVPTRAPGPFVNRLQRSRLAGAVALGVIGILALYDIHAGWDHGDLRVVGGLALVQAFCLAGASRLQPNDNQ